MTISWQSSHDGRWLDPVNAAPLEDNGGGDCWAVSECLRQICKWLGYGKTGLVRTAPFLSYTSWPLPYSNTDVQHPSCLVPDHHFLLSHPPTPTYILPIPGNKNSHGKTITGTTNAPTLRLTSSRHVQHSICVCTFILLILLGPPSVSPLSQQYAPLTGWFPTASSFGDATMWASSVLCFASLMSYASRQV